jgi:CRP-like cAMP-binding protein
MAHEVLREDISAGTIIFRQGDSEAHFYIIEEGLVGIFLDKNGKTSKITELGPGDSFGEFALLSGDKRSASAQALTELKVFKVSTEGFDELLAQLPDWASCMLKSFVKRMRAMNDLVK